MSKSAAKLIATIRPWMHWLVLAGAAAIGVSFLEQAVPLEVRTVINRAFKIKIIDGTLINNIGALLLLLLFTQFLKIGQRLVAEWVATRLGAILLARGVLHLLSYPMSWFHTNHSAAVQVRLERSTRAIADLIKMGISDILSPIISLFLATAIILHTEQTVGFAVIATIPLLTSLTIWQAKSQSGIRIAINRAREELGVRVVEAVEGIEQVKLFHAEAAEAYKAEQVATALAGREYRHHLAMGCFDIGKFLVERTGFCAVIVLGLIAALRHGSSLGPGEVVMLIMLYDRVAEPIRHLHRLIDETNEKWIQARDYLNLLDIKQVKRESAHPVASVSGEISFQKVSFAYEGSEKQILTDVTVSIPKGHKVALVGKSGSGKSTFVKLLSGLYAPTSGRILVGGQPVQSIENAGCAKLVGMHTQKSYIFVGTIEDNIRYARPDATKEDVQRVIYLAGLTDVIAGCEHGLETCLGQHGSGFSGGQCQRLALARLLLQNPEIIVFDEPTASLDPANSRHFFQSVMHELSEKTVIIITHDHHNLDWADTVIEFDEGKSITHPRL